MPLLATLVTVAGPILLALILAFDVIEDWRGRDDRAERTTQS